MYRPTRPQWRIQKIVHSCYGGGEVVLDAVHASPDLGGQNVLKTFKMAIRHNRRPTDTNVIRERVFCRWIYFHLKNVFLALLRAAIAPVATPPY